MSSRCYIMHVNSGSEWGVIKTLREFITDKKMDSMFDMIIVPEVIDKKNILNKSKDQFNDEPVETLTAEIKDIYAQMKAEQKESKARCFNRDLGRKLEDKLLERESKLSKSSLASHKLMPGYVIVQMEMTNDTWQLCKSVPKVIGFLGVRQDAIASSCKEVTDILDQMLDGVTAVSKVTVSYDVGEQVRVLNGPFATFVGFVEEVDVEKCRLKVSVSIFGRPTPVELEYGQVEKVNK